ncbi:non-ribosomal peptide synthetase [Nostoc sp. NMS1]|uniref:non-ribosomal peptide synthetase n=1 Tax=Nostoc sp. NMS1 TaxID=2815388 RepID=UPI0025DF385F|nr:non-ribosomal peptide synthetase [Nostoc sp. NMS1]
MNQHNKNIESIYPLSPMQQGMLFHTLFAPDSGIYFEQSSYNLYGKLNVSAFEQAWRTIVQRHSVLRTLFVWENTQKPLQVVRKSVNLPWINHDWRTLSSVAQQERVEAFLEADRTQGFQLNQAPLMRCALIRLAEDIHQFVWSHHHLLLDGWSSSLIVKEVLAYYEAGKEAHNLYLPSPRPYKDYITWLQQQDQGFAKTFWQQVLKGFTAPTRLGNKDVSNPLGQKETYGVQEIHLSMALTEDLQALIRKHHLTLNILLQGVWALLLSHNSGQSDVVFGTTVSGRPPELAGVESMVGLFINTLPVRSQISKAASLILWLQQLQAQQVEREQYSYSSLIDIQEWSELPRGMSLFESLLVFENYPDISHQKQYGSLEIGNLRFFERNNYPLTMLAETSPELSLGIGYDRCRFDDAAIAKMLQHLQSLLENIVIQPEQSLSQLLLASGLKAKTEDVNNVSKQSNLTEHQLLIWLGHKFNPNALIYNNPLTFTIPTAIDLIRFQAAFQVLINSSDALRTVFLEVDGVPQQKVLPYFDYVVNFVDFSQVADSATAVSNLLYKRSQIIFDLERCLFDTVLIKLSPDKFVWYLNIHQIIGDGLSLSLIFNYLSELYVIAINNCLPKVIQIPQFQDYIEYEKKYRDSERYHKVKNYWQQKLAEPIEPLSFYGKTPIKTTTFAHRVSYELGFERTQKIKTLAIQEDSATVTENTAMFNIFLAVLAIYLYHISGNQQLTIGIPLHNRRSPTFKKTIGSFVQVLPLHIEIEKTDNFQSLIKKIGTTILTSLRYSQYVVRNPRQNPVYDAVLNYHTSTFVNFAETKIAFDWIHTGHANESLNVQIRDVSLSNNLIIDFDFHCDTFVQASLDLSIQHFLQVLDALLEDSHQSILQVSLLAKLEKQKILVDFNQTQTAFPEQIFTQLFTVQAQKTPEQVAVVFAEHTVTYAQLNAQVNQLAHYLQSLGVKTEVLVGVYIERSLEMLVAFLAILKAGGVYVPLDPAYPQERLAYILANSQVSVLLTHKSIKTKLPEHKADVVYLDADWPVISQHSQQNPDTVVTGENLAYVIYTSGSTGMPKGVMITHRGMLNHLYAKVLDLKLTESDAIAQTAPQSFDISVWQLLVGLLVGGRVHIFNNEVVRNPAKLLEQIQQHEISILEVVPSLLQMMLQEIDLHNQKRPHLSKLRWLILTGEALPPKLCDRWLEYYPTIPMLNAYGPTECSDDVTHYPIYHPLGIETLNTPIGKAVANTQLYILNPQLQPVPIGVAGELYVGGTGVGRGYLNNPELTTKVFIPNPFGLPGTRLYKTGDKARYLNDGNIEFLGRIDYQVKIRGFRIELLEIEAVLAQHPKVQECVVILWEQSGDKRLVGYVVPHRQVETPDLEVQLRHFLKERLPEYMMPSAFVMLESLPLTPNGKVDRRALPAPDKSNFIRKTKFVPPRGSLELQLTSIWEGVLNLHPIGVQDNFFELGGHSLLAVHLMAQIQQQLEKNLPLATLLQNPTIEQMASTISQHQDSQSWSPLVAIQPDGSKTPFFCVPGGAMDVIEFYHLARSLGSEQPFYGLQPRGLDGELEPHTRIEEMASCYIAAIQTIQPQGPYLLGGHSFGGYVAFEMAQQLQQQGHEVALLAILDVMAIVPNLNKPVTIDGDDAKDLIYLIRLMERFFEKKVEFSYETLLTLDAEAKLNYLAERLKVANLLPPQVGTKQLRGFLKVSKATGEAFDFYLPQHVYPSQITCFRASEVNSDDVSSLFEYSEILQDPALGWNEFSSKTVEVHIVPGDHVTMMTQPHVLTLADRLQTCIEKAQVNSGVK